MIKTERLVLRSFMSLDAPSLVREFSNYNIVRHTARIPFPYHLKDAEEYLTILDALKPRSKSCAIAFPSTPLQLIGGISYLYSEEKDDAEIGYWLSEPYWGQGFMSEAARTMIADGFAQGIQKFVACYHADNSVSAKILQRLGFVNKGTCKKFSKAQGKDVDVVNMVLER
jgi:RimJ/RimL family protein N-acetyltransferase